MGSLVEPDATASRLKLLVRVVDPWLQREISALTELAQPVSDAAMMRWLRFTTIDHDGDHQAVAALLAGRADDAIAFAEHALISEIDLTR